MTSARGFDQLVEDYFTESRCPRCRQVRTATGCECSRERFAVTELANADQWVEKHLDELGPRARRTVQAAYQAAQSRTLRRGGMPSDSLAAIEMRADTNVRFGLVPKWHPRRVIRTPRADNEPI